MATLTTAEIRAFLESMGSTSDEVAEWLTQEGAEGYPKVPYCDPVGLALTVFVGSPVLVTVGGVEIERGDTLYFVPLPPPVAEFVWRFDNLQYPNLILEADS